MTMPNSYETEAHKIFYDYTSQDCKNSLIKATNYQPEVIIIYQVNLNKNGEIKTCIYAKVDINAISQCSLQHSKYNLKAHYI